MATLALFGAAHLFLIWPGDILLHYALIGMLALPLRRARAAPAAPHRDPAAVRAARRRRAVLRELPRAATTPPRLPGASADDARRLAQLRRRRRRRAPAGGRRRDRDGARIMERVRRAQSRDAGERPALPARLRGARDAGVHADRHGGAAIGIPDRRLDARKRYLSAAAIGFAIGLPPTIALCWLSFASGFDTLATFAAAHAGRRPLPPDPRTRRSQPRDSPGFRAAATRASKPSAASRSATISAPASR